MTCLHSGMRGRPLKPCFFAAIVVRFGAHGRGDAERVAGSELFWVDIDDIRLPHPERQLKKASSLDKWQINSRTGKDNMRVNRGIRAHFRCT